MLTIGIDFGARMSGKTVICYEHQGSLRFLRSAPKQDADLWVRQQIDTLKPALIAIDAPLSLPAAYHGAGDDFMFRVCDRKMRAMSPMFLGGLTARAMALSAAYPEMKWLETYPSARLRKVLKYTKKDSSALQEAILCISQFTSTPVEVEPRDWHEYDALVCWSSAQRYVQEIHETIGDPEEGLIVI